MATAERKKTSRPVRNAQPPQPARRRFRRWLLTFALGGGLLVAALPTILTWGPWRDALIGCCVAGLNGRVSTESLSVGWFSPLTATDVSVIDPQTQRVLYIASLTTEKSLLGLLAGPTDLGKVTIDGLQANLVLREDGSNIEDLIANYLHAPPRASTPLINLELDLSNGHVAIQDTSSGQQCTIERLAVHAACNANRLTGATVGGTIVHDGRSGPLALKLSTQPADPPGANASGSPTGGNASGSLAVKIQEFPLGVCQALVCRQLPHTKLAGALAADVTCQVDANDKGQPRRAANGQVEITGLAVAGPLLKGDRLAMDKLTVPCQAVWEENRLDISRLQATCDVGQFSAAGTLLEPQQVAAITSVADLAGALSGSSGEVSGNIDLAKLARLLPRSIGLKSGVQLTAGSLSWQLSGKDVGGQPSYSGTVDASKLVAQAKGRQLSWESPLHASFAAHGKGRAAVLDQLQCQSDFVELTAQGNVHALQASGKYDLGRLCDQLGQFIDLGTRRVDGQGAFSANYQCDAAGAFNAAAQFNLDQLQMTVAGNPWTDQAWTLAAQVNGKLPPGGVSVKAAQITGQFGSDQVSVKLAPKPVSMTPTGVLIPIVAHVTGQAGTWLSRAQALGVVLPGVAAAGQIDLQVSAQCSPETIVVDSAVLTSQPLEIRSPQLTLEEPEARVEGSGRVELAGRSASGWKARLQTTSFSADLADGAFAWAPGQQGLSGAVDFAGDLVRLQNSLGLTGGAWRVGGMLIGKGTIRQSGSSSAIDMTAGIDNLIGSPAQGQAIAAGKVALALKGDYDNAADTLRLATCNLSCPLMVFEAAGTIQQAASRPTVDLSGRWEYDLETLTALLQPKFGNNIQLSGHEARSFRLQGPLVATDTPASTAPAGEPSNGPPAGGVLTGQATLGWETANLYGFQLGPATLEAQCDRGALRLIPATLAVNGGHVNLGGQVQPLSAAGMFTMSPGVIVDHVQIAEQLGHPTLKFILPMASQSQVQGQISVSISNCQVPVANPDAGDVSGQLTIHELEMTRGPFMQELAGLLKRNEPAQLAQNSVVPFRMVQGRIYHEGLVLKLHEITVRTYGSVGLVDQSLAIMAEVPVPLSWLAAEIAHDPSKQKTIHVPIGGTLNKPQIDHREVERLAAQFVRQASEGVLRNGIAKPLERLLGTPPAEGNN